jgi:hypothetical protein
MNWSIGCYVSPAIDVYEERATQAFAHAERWQSGRMHRTRNAAYLQGYRGFESTLSAIIA